MSVLAFLIKSSACLALFLVFYKLVLERERMHVFKRFYLLAALLLSFVIPTVTFTEYVEVTSVSEKTIVSERVGQEVGTFENRFPRGDESSLVEPLSEPALINESENIGSDIYGLALLLAIYSIGVTVFAFKFIRNLWSIRRDIQRNTKIKLGKVTKVLLPDAVVPYTFLKYIFLNRDKYRRKDIPVEVILHERTHALQIHSLDIMLLELLQIIFWFNPLLYLHKTSMKLNHEFLADQAVIDRGASTPGYQELLLSFASSANGQDNQPSLVNAINYSSYSSIKKRFTIMKKQTSRKSKIWRSILLIPMLALLFYGFSNRVKIPIPSDTGIEMQEGATKKQIREYNGLAKKYNDMLAKKGNIRIKKQEVNRLETLFSFMTESQRAEAEPFPDFPDPPEPPAPPMPPDHSEVEIENNQAKLIKHDDTREELDEDVQIEIEEREVQTTEVEVQENAVQEIVENQEIYDHLNKTILIRNNRGAETALRLPPTPPAPQPLGYSLNLNSSDQNKGGTVVLDTDEEKGSNERISLNYVKDANKSVPKPPSPPAPKSPLELLEEFKDDNVKIIVDGRKVNYKKARTLFEENTFSRVDIRKENGDRPVLRVWTQ